MRPNGKEPGAISINNYINISVNKIFPNKKLFCCFRSPEWQFIPQEEKDEIGLTFDRDGEFWMSFRDFSAHYSRLEIVNLNADSLEEEELSGNKTKRWQANEFVGNWVKGASAGGCRNHLGRSTVVYLRTYEDQGDFSI